MEHYKSTSPYILPAEEMFRDLDSYVFEESKTPVVRETTLMDSMMSILSTGRTDTDYHCLDSSSVSCDHVTVSGSSADNQTSEFYSDESLDVNNNDHQKKEENGAPLMHIYPEGLCEGTVGADGHHILENQTLPFTLTDNQSPGLGVSTLSPPTSVRYSLPPEGDVTVNQSTLDTSALSGYHSSPCMMTTNQARTSPPNTSTLVTTKENQMNAFSPVSDYQSVGQILTKDPTADNTDPSSPAAECQFSEMYNQIETQSTSTTKAGKSQTKPPYSCIAMITMAIQNAPEKKMTLREIYGYISSSFPYFSDGKKGWQNTVRFNLSRNDCFIRVKREKQNPGKGSYWALHPECGDMFKDGCFLRRNRKFRLTKKQEKEGHKVDNMAAQVKMPTVDTTQSFEKAQMTSNIQLPQSYTPTYVPGSLHEYTNYYQGSVAIATQRAHTELSHQSYYQPSYQMLTAPGFSAYHPAQWHSPMYYQNWQ